MSQFRIKKARKKILRREGMAYQTMRFERSFPTNFKARTPDHHHRKVAAAIPNQGTLDNFLAQLAEGPERDMAFEVLKPLLRFPALNRLAASKLDEVPA